MTEILFYHLQRQPLERVLPTLLEKSLERGWRVVVQAASEERAEARSVREALRLARLTFLRSYAGIVYAELTGDFERGLRVDELCYAAADRYPGLVPTRAAVLAERRQMAVKSARGPGWPVEPTSGLFQVRNVPP